MSKLEDRVLIAGILLSLGITTVLWVLNQDRLSTILIGLSTTAITFLMENSIRVRSVRSEMSGLLGFSDRLSRDVWMSKTLKAITANYFQVLEKINDPLFQTRVKDIIQEGHDKTATLALGRLELTADEDPSYSLKVWQRAKSRDDRILAVSYNKNRDWWLSETQKSYFQRNIDLARRGVRIRRIFVLQQKDVEGMRDVVKEMHKANIECFIAIEEKTPARFVGGYVIVCGKIAKTWHTTATGKEQGGEIIVDPITISTLERDFEQLMLYSRSVREVFELDMQIVGE